MSDEAPRAADPQVDRLRRLQDLDELLPTLAGVLDIREVFERVSTIAKRVLPHDMLALPLVLANRCDVEVYAITGNLGGFPETHTLSDQHRKVLTTPWEYMLFDDIQNEPSERNEPPGRAGYRSLLRIPIRLHGELAGAIDFASRTPGLYPQADVLVARRIADHVALALSHQQLAEEAGRPPRRARWRRRSKRA
jgi:GAF domain-containing protein